MRIVLVPLWNIWVLIANGTIQILNSVGDILFNKRNTLKTDMMKNIDEIISALHDGTLQESETIEFKRTLPKVFPLIAKVIVGIANSGGGYLILGVTD